jgi:hypothetical protein
MSTSDVDHHMYASTGSKWKNLFKRSATVHRQAVTAAQDAHPEEFVHQPETGFAHQFECRDFHSSASDFQPLCDALKIFLFPIMSTLVKLAIGNVDVQLQSRKCCSEGMACPGSGGKSEAHECGPAWLASLLAACTRRTQPHDVGLLKRSLDVL